MDRPTVEPTAGWRGPYIRYVAGRSVSTAGTNPVNVIMAFAVLRVGGDGLAVGLVLACSVRTQTVLLPVGGVLADRVPRRFLVVAGNTVLATVQGITGAATAAVQPAFQGLIVQLVPVPALQRANASLRLVLNLARIAVPGLGALLGAEFGFGQVLLAAGASFAACALILLGLRVRMSARESRRSALMSGGREGWQAFRSRPVDRPHRGGH